MGRRGRSIFGDQGLVFFITTTAVDFSRVFDCGEQYYFILLNSLKYVLAEHGATLFAYVFMPNHIHFVVALPPGEKISDLMRDFKKYTSTRIRQQLEKDGYSRWVERLRANVGRKLRTSPSTGGVRTSVLTRCKEDVRNAQVNNVRRELLTSLRNGRKKQVFKLWMDRFDDVVIYSDKVLRTKISYIHDNPVRAGLVKEAADWEILDAGMRQETIPHATSHIR